MFGHFASKLKVYTLFRKIYALYGKVGLTSLGQHLLCYNASAGAMMMGKI